MYFLQLLTHLPFKQCVQVKIPYIKLGARGSYLFLLTGPTQVLILSNRL